MCHPPMKVSTDQAVGEVGRVKYPPGGDKDAGAERDSDFPRWLFAQQCVFVTAAAKPHQLPDMGLPGVAFAGRSNVGKAGLSKRCTGRRGLGR